MYQARESVITGNERENAAPERAEIFSIPYRDKFIIFAPLKKIAFLGNRPMVNLIGLTQQGRREGLDRQMLEFIDRLGLLKADVPPGETAEPAEYEPATVVLMMGNKCNLRCTYCYASSGEYPAESMPWELARQGIDMAAANAARRKLDFFELSFHGGGEPTLNWPVLEKAVYYARTKPLKAVITMATNGLLNSRQQQFVTDNFDGLSLSFDGLPEIQNSQRPASDGRDSWPYVERTIAALDAKKLPYGIRITVMPDSAGYLSRMIEFVCAQTGAGHIQVEPVFPVGRGAAKRWDEQSLRVFAGQYPTALREARKSGRHFFYSGATPDAITSRFCTAALEAMVLLPTGDISACFEVHSCRHERSPDFIFGRLTAGRAEIDKAKWHKIATRDGGKIAWCRDCFCRFSCAGDCLNKTYGGGRPDDFKPSWRCSLNRELSKQKLLDLIAENQGLWQGLAAERS